MNGEQKNLMPRFANVKKKITIQTNRINLPAPVEMKKCPSPKKQISFSLESCIAFLLHFEEQCFSPNLNGWIYNYLGVDLSRLNRYPHHFTIKAKPLRAGSRDRGRVFDRLVFAERRIVTHIKTNQQTRVILVNLPSGSRVYHKRG